MANGSKWLIESKLADESRWWSSWDELNRGSFESHPLLDSRFIRSLCRHFSRHGLVYAQLKSSSGSVLVQTVLERGGQGRWQVFCPAQAGVGALVFSRQPGGTWLLLRNLLARIPGLSLALTLPYQDAPYSWVADASGSLVHRTLLGTTMTVITSDYEAYWNERPKVMRDNLRRHMKRPAKEGMSVQLRQVKSVDQISDAVDRYADLESSGWKGKEGTALSRENVQGQFYREMMVAFAGTGDARVAELYFDTKLVAARLLVSGPSMHVILKTTFDESMRNFSPGHSQLQLLMAELIAESPGKPIEFYTKATKDWLQWATHTRPIESVTVYRHPALNWLAARRRRNAESDQQETAPAEAAAPT